MEKKIYETLKNIDIVMTYQTQILQNILTELRRLNENRNNR